MTIDLNTLSTKALLSLSSEITQELRQRGILRTNNKPIGDYAEWLVATKLNLQLTGNSNPKIDAIDLNNKKYQIKSRMIKNINRAKPLVQIRSLAQDSFDYLIVVYLNSAYEVQQCLLIPTETVIKYAIYNKHTNAFIFRVTSSLMIDSSIKDITLTINS